MSQGCPPLPPSDEELARRAQRGSMVCFEQLLRKYQAPLLHFLRQRGAGADAEDLLQETFVRAYTHLDRYDPRWAFSTWLFTIARRVGLNHHRRARPAADQEAAGEAMCPGRGPVQTAMDAEHRRLLWDTAQRVLGEEEWTALWLHYVEGLPARDVARVLHRSWVAVKTKLFRARRKLLPLLKDLAPEDAGDLDSPGYDREKTAGQSPEPDASHRLEKSHGDPNTHGRCRSEASSATQFA